MPYTRPSPDADNVSGLRQTSSEEERQRAARAQMPPPSKRRVPTEHSSAKRARVEVPLESPGASFGSANPDLEEELRIVRRAAGVAVMQQVLDGHVPDRGANASRVPRKVTVVKTEATDSSQDIAKVEQQDSKKGMGAGDRSKVLNAVPRGKEENKGTQDSESIQAAQSGSGLDAWTQQQWATYFGYPPDPWWYDRDWQNWR